MRSPNNMSVPLVKLFLTSITAMAAVIICLSSFILYKGFSKSLKEQQKNYAVAQAKQLQVDLDKWLENHNQILQDFGDFPLIKQAVQQPESRLSDAADLMQSFSFLGKKFPLVLVDFEGIKLHETFENKDRANEISKDLVTFFSDENLPQVSIFSFAQNYYFHFCSELKINESREGALSALIPVNAFINQTKRKGDLNYELYFRDQPISPKNTLIEYVSAEVNISDDLRLIVYSNTTMIIQSQNRFFKEITLLMISIIIVVTVLGFLFINKTLLKPITSLSEMTNAVTQEKSQLPVPISTPVKELETLQEDFKSMINSLYEKNIDLINAKVELELRVKERTAELETKAEELERVSKYKSEFLARMSHEIRTPMNAIIGYAELLSETNMTEEQNNNLKTIINSADALLTIINDILDFSKIEAGMLTVEEIPFNLNKILDELNSLFCKQADDKGVELNVNTIEDEFKWLVGDPHRIRQVLINLTGNAIKFTQKGSVKVIIRVKKMIDNKINLNIYIKDTGIGIPAHKIKDIFNSFSQAEGSTTRRFGGTGLGLPISRELSELMGGSLEVTSKQGEGSTFNLNLQLELTKAIEEKKTITHSWDWARSPNILLVEDNLVNRKLATKTLEKFNIKLQVCCDGQEAVDLLENEKSFDLILMDCQMPVMNGLDASRQIRIMDDVKDIPIVAFTANAMESEIEDCLEAGMNDWISKPFKKEMFEEKLKKWLGHLLLETEHKVS